jgi:hypothetical protein
MTAKLYQEWIRTWDKELEAKGWKILLLQDNFSGHIVPNDLKNIEVKNLAPNLTAHIQPMDQGIIKSFKAHYHAKYIQRVIDNYDANITPSKIYDIDQLEAMRLANAAWDEVDATTIQHCWHKAGILPDLKSSSSKPSIPISSLINATSKPSVSIPISSLVENPVACAEELLVKDVLDRLEETGALQSSNRISIEALLNPIDEVIAITETTDEEIYGAVMDAWKVHEAAAITGTGDHDVDDDAINNTGPSRKEALQASLMLKKYLQDLDDSFTRKLEEMLSSFGHKTHLIESQNLKPTLVTDYFPRIN